MGRIRQAIAVDGRTCWTLFDSGARNTYVTPSVAELLKTSLTPRTIRTAPGGAIPAEEKLDYHITPRSS